MAVARVVATAAAIVMTAAMVAETVAGAAGAMAAETAPASYDRIGVPTVVLWPEFDPLFPRAWSDRLDDFFSDVRLRFVDGVGHYAPLEYPEVLAEEIVGLG